MMYGNFPAFQHSSAVSNVPFLMNTAMVIENSEKLVNREG